MTGLDRAVALAGRAAPPPLDPARADRMIAAALAAATGARRRRRAVVAVAAAAAAAALAAGLALAWLWRGGAATRAAAALHLELPGGDQVTSRPGTLLFVEEASPSARRLVLREGSALFEVAPLAAGERFAVVSQGVRVEVRGTIFTVSASPRQTVVRVYEGRVQVRTGDLQAELAAGQSWSSTQPTGAAETSAPELEEGADPLAAEAAAAIRRRLRATASVTPLPTAEPLPSSRDHIRPSAEEPPHVTRPGAGAVAVAGSGSGSGSAPVSASDSVPVSASDSVADTAADADAAADAAAAADADADATPAPDLYRVGRWIADGHAERALAAARAGADRAADPGPWRLAEADALRALHRYRSAAAAYERAAALLPEPAAAQAGYRAAYLRLHRLRDPVGALASLDATGADADRSPVAERALALRVEALTRAGLTDQAQAAARRYRLRFPSGGGLPATTSPAP